MKTWVVKEGRYKRRMVYVYGEKVKYARYVMEQKLCRKLNSNEIVHHIDGNTLNDNDENLSILQHGDHCALHNFQRICSQESKEKMSRSRKGRFINAEWREKMRMAKVGERNHQFKHIDMGIVRDFLREGIAKRKIASIFGISKTTLHKKLALQEGQL